jgi:hypothetical protein
MFQTKAAPILAGLLLAAAPQMTMASSNVVDLDVPDVELVDQDSHRSRFVSEVIGDRLAAVTFTFTSWARKSCWSA